MTNDRAYVIAEIGVNHNGRLADAIKLVEAAGRAKANAVKIQAFSAEAIATVNAKKAAYQIVDGQAEQNQQSMLKALELSEEEQISIRECVESLGMDFIATPFDLESLMSLYRIGVRTIKVSSSEITNAPFLYEIARRAQKIILSTGMSTLSDVESALGVIAYGLEGNTDLPQSIADFKSAYMSPLAQKKLFDRVTLLHCTSAYPTPTTDINLRAISTLRSSFGLKVGFSDHTTSLHFASIAVALGACMIEKHITLDKNQFGPDHKSSLEPDEFAILVAAIRDTEIALGDGIKRPTAAENVNKDAVRKVIVASGHIKAGEAFTERNLAFKRAGRGRTPFEYWRLLNQISQRDYEHDEPIE